MTAPVVTFDADGRVTIRVDLDVAQELALVLMPIARAEGADMEALLDALTGTIPAPDDEDATDFRPTMVDALAGVSPEEVEARGAVPPEAGPVTT